jgi:hypothetical protein
MAAVFCQRAEEFRIEARLTRTFILQLLGAAKSLRLTEEVELFVN